MLDVMAVKRMLLALAMLWPLLVGIPTAFARAAEEVQNVTSTGYRITEINELADGSGVVARLKLISGCDTYGPDLEDLVLTARYGNRSQTLQSGNAFLRLC